jgi:hypothetical protein
LSTLCKIFPGSLLCCVLVVPATAQDAEDHAARHHPPQDLALHEKFYSTWHMPDHPSASCCNNADCYPTEIKVVDGNIYAKRGKTGSTFLSRRKKSSGIEIIPTAETTCALRRPVSRIHPMPCSASR